MTELPAAGRADSMARVRAVWAELAGADAFPQAGLTIVTNGASRICPPGWVGVVGLDRGILAVVPDDAHRSALTPTLDGLTVGDDWASVFGSAPERRGPASLAYADHVHRSTAGVDTPIEVCAASVDDVLAFVRRVPAADREEAGVEESTSQLACVREGDAVIAVSGYRDWLGVVAHISVLVDPHWRNRGLATAVARAATEDAVRGGFVAQWRARPADSRAVARKLGYAELGQQISPRSNARRARSPSGSRVTARQRLGSGCSRT